jgi:hypothetical protein
MVTDRYESEVTASAGLPAPTAASRVASRIASREAGAAQVRAVAEVNDALCGAQIVLCGSAALHGVYLHNRRPPIVDMVTDPGTAARFYGKLKDRGVNIERVCARNEFALGGLSRLFPGLFVYLRVHALANVPPPGGRRSFGVKNENQVEFAVYSLRDLGMAKLACAASRGRFTDFLDLWFLSRAGEETTAQVAHGLARQPVGRSSHEPRRPLDADLILSRLDRLKDNWPIAMEGLQGPLPGHGDIAARLREWLPALTQ